MSLARAALIPVPLRMLIVKKPQETAGDCGIIFEATVRERTYKRQGTNQGGWHGVARSVTADSFTRTCGGHHWCARPEFLHIRRHRRVTRGFQV